MSTMRFAVLHRLLSLLTWPFRHWRVFAVLIVALAILHTVADQLLLRWLATQREALRAAGLAASFADFGLPKPDDPGNAEVAYRYIATQIRYPEDDKEAFEQTRALVLDTTIFVPAPSDEEDAQPRFSDEWKRIEEYVALNEATCTMLREAVRLPRCQFNNYDNPLAVVVAPEAMMPSLGHVRDLARHMAVMAAWAHRHGRLGEAYEWTTAGIRLANQLNADPLLIVGLVRVACARAALQGLQILIQDSELPETLPEGMMEELEKLADRRQDELFYQGELCFAHAQALHMGLQTGRLSRPVFQTPNQLAINNLMVQIVTAVREEDYTKREAMLAPVRELYLDIDEAFGLRARWMPFIVLARMSAPALLRAQDAFEAHHARTDGAILAIALKQYKRDHGTYPDDLAPLAPTYIRALPQDPFTGEPFRYLRKADGFDLYSVGENRKDDGGTPADKPFMGDIVWSAVR